MAQVPLLPPRVQFFDNNGDPLSGGKIYTYEAGTSTPKSTYTDAAGGTPNANPVVLDSAGRATIWGSGAYKVIVKDSSDVTITSDDNYTAFAASSSSTFSDSAFALQDNSDATKQLQFECSSINPGSTTIIIVPNGNATMVTNTGTQTLTNKTLTAPTITTPVYTAEASVASATTTDLASGSSNYVSVTGTTTITSFGSNAATTNPIYFVRFTGALTLTHNATSLILPGGANITTAAGDAAVAKYEGSGNWRVVSYTRASGAGWTVLSSGSLNTGATLSVNSLSQSYTRLKISWSAVSFDTATRRLVIGVDDATTFAATVTSDYSQMLAASVVTTNANSEGLTSSFPTQAAASTCTGWLIIENYKTANAGYTGFTLESGSSAGGGFVGKINNTAAIQSLQFALNGSGSFDGSGTYTVEAM